MRQQPRQQQPHQSPSTGESAKEHDQKQQEPATVDVTEKPDVSRSGATSESPLEKRKGPKSGGMGPRQ